MRDLGGAPVTKFQRITTGTYLPLAIATLLRSISIGPAGPLDVSSAISSHPFLVARGGLYFLQ